MAQTPRRPLAQRIADELRGRFLTAVRPGGRLPSVVALAAELGVSVLTVRAAQAILAREGLLEIQHGSGVYLAARKGTRRVGIVSELDLLRPRASSFFAATVCGLRDYFSRQGIETEFFMGESLPGDHRQKPSCGRFVQEVEVGRLDGAVLVSAPETEFWRRFIDGCPIPLVGAGTGYHAGTDYRELVRKGMQALAAQGGRRLAVLGGWLGDGSAETELRALARRSGLELREGWTRHDLHPQHRGAGWEEFREIWSAHREKPDALLVTDDVLFGEAQIAILELGIRVPEHLRIATHANVGAEPRPPFPVTLLRVDAAWCADRLGELLLQRMDGEAVEPGLRSVPIEVVGVNTKGARFESIPVDSVEGETHGRRA
jgi:DNA-binding LacI/PurR family transcriptional regulator